MKTLYRRWLIVGLSMSIFALTGLKRALEVADKMASFDPKALGLLRRFGREAAGVHSKPMSEHAVALMSVMLAERAPAH